jgi:hypothetical protein
MVAASSDRDHTTLNRIRNLQFAVNGRGGVVRGKPGWGKKWVKGGKNAK